MFLNGIQVATNTGLGTSTINNGSTTYLPTIASNATGNANTFTGYISNLRFIIGSGGYNATSSTIIVPTAPLTATANTKVLSCQSNRFVDNSANNYTITPSGSPSVQSFSPFAPTADYSTSTIGGSYYGDGSGDYVINTTNSLQIASSTNFTFECWLYRLSTFSGDQGTCFFAIGSEASNRIQFTMFGSAIRVEVYAGTLDFNGGTVPLNAWTHVAIVRSSNTMSIYINGVFATSAAWSNVVGTTGGFIVGANRSISNYVNGYISGLRLLNGTALYTSAFTPPTAPLTAITNTTLLLNFTNAGIYDATAKNDVETIGTAKISTVQSKWGSGAMYFDGSSSSWLSIPFNRNLDLSTGTPNWTLECWVYVNSYSNAPFIFNKGGLAAAYYTNYGFAVPANGIAYMHLGNNGGESSYNFGSISTGVWYYLAGTRQGNTIRTFLNGTLVTETSIGASMSDNGQELTVGVLKNLTTNVLNGYINDLRITKGLARYTTSFTPPSNAFPLK